MKDIDEYQDWTDRTWMTNRKTSWNTQTLHACIGLAEETGELMGKVKRALRGDIYTPDWCYSCESDLDDSLCGLHKNEAVQKELGDIAYYLARAAKQCGFKMSEILGANIAKLEDRMKRGQLSGSGDAR
jgi:NTP pyrophosphatase (non-canonical NTP hydrolase)